MQMKMMMKTMKIPKMVCLSVCLFVCYLLLILIISDDKEQGEGSEGESDDGKNTLSIHV